MDKPQPPTSPPDVPLASQADLTGQTLGDFHVLLRLGQGGMGQVFLAEQVSLRRKVALKILRADLAGNPASLQRFKAEAEAVARATHANIVQVYAIGEAQGLHFMALEYVEGRNLRDYLDKKGTIDLPLALSIMRQVAAALQRAGELGVIHRDVKPENILLTRRGEAKVADFGLSRCFAPDRQSPTLTQSGVAMGTPLYMSPEQVEGKAIDPRTDIYSFGATCYHMLAGVPPFQGETAYQLALKHVSEEPVPLNEVRPDLPADLCAVVHKTMAKDPAQRHQTCREILQDLQRVRDNLAGLKTETLSTPGQTAGESISLEAVPRKAPGGRRWLLGVLVALTLVLAVSVGVLLGRSSARPIGPATAPPAALPAAARDEGIAGIFSPSGREEFLKKAVEQYANPKGNATERRHGVEFALELGLLYLEQWRLDEAARLFSGLIANKYNVKEYRTLGRVGRAIVLAFQNQAAASNKHFMELGSEGLSEGARFEGNGFLYRHAQLRQMVARALEYNYANDPGKFPASLEYLRRPPNPFAPGPGRRGPEKGAGKGPG
jgi:serine/threonine-protein kinase